MSLTLIEYIASMSIVVAALGIAFLVIFWHHG
jgi:hypothetical protein